MSIRDAVQNPIIEAWPPECWCDVTALVAVSGGADSVALLHASMSVRRPGTGRLMVAHFNHGLRGKESDGDERFVRDLSAQLGLECEVGRALSAGQTTAAASEQTARAARYAFLCDVAARHGARYVATAHTTDDQAETVLHRVIRGTGIGGLAGIQKHRELLHGVSLVRPLLQVRRSVLLEYLHDLGQDYRQDSSNRSLEFTRNRLRHDLIPRLQRDYNAQVIPALGRLANLAEELQQWLEPHVNELLAACVRPSGGKETEQVQVDCQILNAVPPLLVRELFVAIWRKKAWPRQAMGFDKWDDLAWLALGPMQQQECRKLMLPGGIIAQRLGPHLTLGRPA